MRGFGASPSCWTSSVARTESRKCAEFSVWRFGVSSLYSPDTVSEFGQP
jgi:hypothetical protein